MSYSSVEDYVKNAESNRNPAVLNSLLESEPGMKELPEITAEDEGKILQVSNGSPSWSSGSSGGGVLVVHDVDGTLDKTWQEIADAGFAILRIENDVGITCKIGHSDEYDVIFAMLLPTGAGFDDPLGYYTDTASGYPVMQ